MTTSPRALRLLHAAVPEVGGETMEQHLRNAVQLLIFADERVAQLTIPPDPQLAELLRGAEARGIRAPFEARSGRVVTAIGFRCEPVTTP